MNVTIREKEILYNLSEGFSSREIGDRLFISRHTVETHKRNLMSKLRAKNAVHLTVVALEHGILQLAKLNDLPEFNS